MKTAEANWIDLGASEDIPRRGARLVRSDAGCIAVFRTQDDRVFALEDRCPHKKGPLSQGLVHGASVTCPLHNWVIDLESGEAQGADEGRVRTFPARVVEGRLMIERRALAGLQQKADAVS
jgi:nitrite reductase (NADH) small subunit